MKFAALSLFSIIFLTRILVAAPAQRVKALELELYDSSSVEQIRSLRVVDKNTGKVAQVMVQKTEREGQPWAGVFIFQFVSGKALATTLEFSEKNGKPFFIYNISGKNVQRVVLFKSKEEMLKFRQQYQNRSAQNSKGKVPSKLALRTLQKTERENKRQQEQKQNELEQEQAIGRAKLLEQQATMTLVEKSQKKALARSLVDEADALYKNQDYSRAVEKYAQAVNEDPEEESYFYRYGVTLYKVEDYNKSLAILSIAEVDSSMAMEKDYYIALNHLKLQNYDKAKKEFLEIRSLNDSNLSPMSSYFAGNIELQQLKFSEARTSMEYILDNSQDPALDRSAEDLLERIDRLQLYHESKKEKYRFAGFVGAIYDGNVLNVSTNNASTDVQAIRLNYGVSALAILRRTPTSDLGAHIGVSDYYSTNTQLQGEATLQTADPLQFDVTLPFHKEIELSGRTWMWDINPLYRSVFMSPTGGTRSEVIRTLGVNTTVAAPFRENALMAVRFEGAQEENLLSTSVGDDDQSSTRYGVMLMPTWLLDSSGSRFVSADLGYLVNNAKGNNFYFARTSLGLTYGFRYKWGTSVSLRGEYSMQDYERSLTPRKDSNPILTAAINKNISRNLNWAMSVQYNVGESDQEAYRYNKFVVMSMLSFNHSIAE